MLVAMNVRVTLVSNQALTCDIVLVTKYFITPFNQKLPAAFLRPFSKSKEEGHGTLRGEGECPR